MVLAMDEVDAVNELADNQAWLGARAGGSTTDKTNYIWESTGARVCNDVFNQFSPRCCHTSRVTTGGFGRNTANQDNSNVRGTDVSGAGTNLGVVCEYRCRTGERSLVRSGNGVVPHQIMKPDSWFNKELSKVALDRDDEHDHSEDDGHSH